MKYPESACGWKEVKEITGLSEMTIRRMMAAGTFPLKFRLTKLRVAWDRAEVQAWVVNCKEGRK